MASADSPSEVAPTPSPASAAPTPAPQRTLLSALGLALVVGLALLGGYTLVLRQLRQSAAYRPAVAQLKGSAQLRALLGDGYQFKIDDGEIGEDHQNAHFIFVARGDKGSADVEVVLKREGKVWRAVDGTITTEDGVLPLSLAVEVDPKLPKPDPKAEPKKVSP
jgi:hypothetical protein